MRRWPIPTVLILAPGFGSTINTKPVLSLKTALPLLLTAVADGDLTIDDVRTKLCENPAQIFGLTSTNSDTEVQQVDAAWQGCSPRLNGGADIRLCWMTRGPSPRTAPAPLQANRYRMLTLSPCHSVHGLSLRNDRCTATRHVSLFATPVSALIAASSTAPALPRPLRYSCYAMFVRCCCLCLFACLLACLFVCLLLLLTVLPGQFAPVRTTVAVVKAREPSSPPRSAGPGFEPTVFGKPSQLKAPQSPTRSRPTLQRGYVRYYSLCLPLLGLLVPWLTFVLSARPSRPSSYLARSSSKPPTRGLR